MRIFPCSATKEPLTPNGFKDARPFNDWPVDTRCDYWGAPTGAVNGFVVVDVDKKGGGIETAANFKWECEIRQTTQSGGYHLFYKVPEGLELRNRVRFLPGVDLRADGGYVIMYEDVNLTNLPEMPPWLLTLLDRGEKKLVDIDADGDGVGEGGRNHFLARKAGSMQRIGVLTLAGLTEVNEKSCEPPLDAVEVEAIYESVKRYAPDDRAAHIDLEERPIIWVSEMVGDMFGYLRDKGMTLGESTGISHLDTLLGGGKRLGELTVTMAEAKAGKNTFWHYQMKDILDRGLAIGYASRELSPETEVLPNLLTVKLGKNLYKEDVSEDEVMTAIKGWRLAFAPGYGAFHGDELFKWMEECLLHGVRYFWVDHLHYCLVDSEDFRLLSEFGRRIKTFAKTNMVHIDLIIQPKNVPFVKQGDKLVPQDLDIGLLRGGANLGQVLDSLITMTRCRDDDGRQIDVTRFELKRARSKLARPGFFYMAYNHDKMSFTVCDDPSGKFPESQRIGTTRVVRANTSPPPSGNVEGFFNGAAKASTMIKRLQSPTPHGNNKE